MDMLGEFAGRMFLRLKPIIDWSLNHWAVTVAAPRHHDLWSGQAPHAASSSVITALISNFPSGLMSSRGLTAENVELLARSALVSLVHFTSSMPSDFLPSF